MSRLALALMLLLCGCSLEEFALRNVPEGPSSSWRYGYADGCWSGRHDAGSRKERDRDVARFRADDQYRDGWEAGYRDCLERARHEVVETPAPEEAVVTAPPPPAPSAPATVAAMPVPTTASSTASAARREEIENRIRQLRAELQALEAELETLPK